MQNRKCQRLRRMISSKQRENQIRRLRRLTCQRTIGCWDTRVADNIAILHWKTGVGSPCLRSYMFSSFERTITFVHRGDHMKFSCFFPAGFWFFDCGKYILLDYVNTISKTIFTSGQVGYTQILLQRNWLLLYSPWFQLVIVQNSMLTRFKPHWACMRYAGRHH